VPKAPAKKAQEPDKAGEEKDDEEPGEEPSSEEKDPQEEDKENGQDKTEKACRKEKAGQKEVTLTRREIRDVAAHCGNDANVGSSRRSRLFAFTFQGTTFGLPPSEH
jgi:hypothetical protein